MLNRLNDYYQEALDGKIVLTKFLDLAEISQIKQLEKKGVKVYFEGGYDGAERLRAIVQRCDYEKPNFADYKIKIYGATYNKNYKEIGHRNVLGSLMSLGIERNTFGDIYIVENNIFLFISEEIEKYLIHNIPNINNQKIDFKQVDNICNFYRNDDTTKIINVSSLRLDAIIAKTLNISRNKAVEIIENKMVSIHHIICEDITHKCNIGEIISIRKFGRIIILENVKTTKKDRLVIKIGVKH